MIKREENYKSSTDVADSRIIKCMCYLHGDGFPGDDPGGGALGDAVTMAPRL